MLREGGWQKEQDGNRALCCKDSSCNICCESLSLDKKYKATGALKGFVMGASLSRKVKISRKANCKNWKSFSNGSWESLVKGLKLISSSLQEASIKPGMKWMRLPSSCHFHPLNNCKAEWFMRGITHVYLFYHSQLSFSLLCCSQQTICSVIW